MTAKDAMSPKKPYLDFHCPSVPRGLSAAIILSFWAGGLRLLSFVLFLYKVLRPIYGHEIDRQHCGLTHRQRFRALKISRDFMGPHTIIEVGAHGRLHRQ
ncbi:hypothetical protein HYPSUDRAFT_711081 [Hypholoma sublateritium FD-334 SS-4]|uniref:Uncharacterized protein n=1 Tax=Hypholoma sublateritium (strain FD-334 SS-4) TaxID=945553 RepID=A0A0D2PJB3_HYPSF|nr:hypothetical protein HYPSUDRAFT_711081 [Hypholoma sublateritium FD-334 SS-4]